MFSKKQVDLNKVEEQKFPTLISLIDRIYKRQDYFNAGNDGSAILSIAYDESGGPVRKVVRRSNYRQTQQFFSKKTNSTQSCESPIEYNGCYILEAIPEIKSYLMQPAVITYLLNGVEHKHIPDVFVELTNSAKFFIEFKAESELSDEALIGRTEVMKKHLPAHGYGYLVVCDNQVSGIPLRNAKMLFHIQKSKISQKSLMEIRNHFDTNASLKLMALVNAFKNKPLIKNYIYQLMVRGILGYDRQQLITEQSELYWKVK